jgi:hypothetical protein
MRSESTRYAKSRIESGRPDLTLSPPRRNPGIPSRFISSLAIVDRVLPAQGPSLRRSSVGEYGDTGIGCIFANRRIAASAGRPIRRQPTPARSDDLRQAGCGSWPAATCKLASPPALAVRALARARRPAASRSSPTSTWSSGSLRSRRTWPTRAAGVGSAGLSTRRTRRRQRDASRQRGEAPERSAPLLEFVVRVPAR